MDLFRTARQVTLVAGLLWLASCGGGGGSPTGPITVAFAPPLPTSLSATETATLGATVTNDSTKAGVNWTVTCGSSACGSFNPTQTASGATTTYTPPPTVPSGATVTITATSAADSTKNASGSVAITAATTTVLADGTYVAHVNGFDANGPYFLAAAFKVQAGAITGGEQDFTDSIAGSADALVPAKCSLSVAGGNIQVVLGTANPHLGVNGAETLRGTVVSASRVLISQFDASATGTGSIDLQTAAATPSGGYAFAVQGTDTSNGFALVIGGILTFSGGSLTIASSVFDLNDGGSAVQQNQPFTAGSITAPDSYGRVAIDLTPNPITNVPEMKFSAYIVGPDRLFLIEDQSDALNANLGGTALGQGANAGHFTAANAGGASYANALSGVDASGGLTLAGTFALNADGTVRGKLAFADASGTHQGNNITNGTWTVDPTGRVTLNNVYLDTTQLTLYFQMYLDGNGNGLVIGVDSHQITAGPAYIQTATQGISGSLAISAQGVLGKSGNPYSAVGPVSVATGTVNGSTDYNNAGSPQSALPLTGSVNATTGALQLTGLNATDFTASGDWGYFQIDNSRTLAIEVDGTGLGLLLLEGVASQ